MILLSSLVILLMAYALWRWKFGESDYAPPGGDPFPAVSVAIYSVLLGILLWSQLQNYRLEEQLARVATELAGRPAQVGCETVLESWMPKNIWTEGYVPLDSQRFFLRHGVCRRLKEVIESAEPHNRFHSTAVMILAHEAMHISGINNEAHTECAALQRVARTAMLLGVPDAVARELARSYWRVQYQQFRQASNNSDYYSIECRPKGSLDEGLPDPPWDLEAPRDGTPR